MQRSARLSSPEPRPAAPVDNNGKSLPAEPTLSFWGIVGTTINVIALTALLGYAVAVLGHSSGYWVLSAFGKNWAADGFCLSYKDTLYHTHLLCLYADTCLSLLLWFLSRRCQGRPELSIVRENVLSVLMHGFAHGGLWLDYHRGGDLLAMTWATAPSTTAAIVRHLSLVPFWMSFTYAMTPSPLWLAAAQSVVHSVLMTTVVPPLLAFTYVNTFISLNLLGKQLLTAPRDVFYVLSGVLYGGPILTATFLEPLLCDSLLVRWGGHIIFDLSIPGGVLLYYAVASHLPPRDAKTAAKKAD